MRDRSVFFDDQHTLRVDRIDPRFYFPAAELSCRAWRPGSLGPGPKNHIAPIFLSDLEQERCRQELAINCKDSSVTLLVIICMQDLVWR